MFVACGRAIVLRKEVDGQYETIDVQREAPWRVAKQLINLGRALARIHGRTVLTGHEIEMLRRVALSSLPSDRRDVLELFQMTKAEQEVVISKCADETEWCVYCTDPAALPYYFGLAQKVGGRVAQHQGGTKLFLPQDSVLLQVTRKLNLSPERRAALAQRMKRLHPTVAA